MNSHRILIRTRKHELEKLAPSSADANATRLTVENLRQIGDSRWRSFKVTAPGIRPCLVSAPHHQRDCIPKAHRTTNLWRVLQKFNPHLRILPNKIVCWTLPKSSQTLGQSPSYQHHQTFGQSPTRRAGLQVIFQFFLLRIVEGNHVGIPKRLRPPHEIVRF